MLAILYEEKECNLLNFKHILYCCSLLLLSCIPNSVPDSISPNCKWLLDEVAFYSDSDTILKSKYYYDYVFDSSGKLLEKTEKDSNNLQQSKYSYAYDINSKLISASIYSNSTKFTHNYTFTYDNGLLVTTDVKRDQLNYYFKFVNTYVNTVLTNTTIYKITFDSLMHEIRSVFDSTDFYYSSNRKAFEVQNSSKYCAYSYNSDNKLVKRTQFTTDTLSAVSYSINYSYDTNGNKFEEKYYLSGKSIQWMTRNYYSIYDNVSIVPEFYMISF